jgi:hypothetical protein
MPGSPVGARNETRHWGDSALGRLGARATESMKICVFNRAQTFVLHHQYCVLPVLICDSGQTILLINNNGLGFYEWVENPDLSKHVRNQESSPSLRRPPPPCKPKHVRSLDCSQSGLFAIRKFDQATPHSGQITTDQAPRWACYSRLSAHR